jgi:YVTN family beta-propeller protein
VAGAALVLAALVIAAYVYVLRPYGAPEASVPGYRVVADLPLTGGTGRFDYQSFDPERHRLYVAHLGASQVIVVDTAGRQVLRTIDGVADVRGVAWAPWTGRLYAAAAGRNQLAVIDPEAGAVVAMVPTGQGPDGVAFDPDGGRVLVSNQSGGTVTVVDARENRRLGDVAVGGDVGNTQYDPLTRRAYTAVGSSNELVVIDPVAMAVVARIPLPGCDGAHGVQLHPTARAAFVACEGNARLVSVDLATGKAGSAQTVGDVPDVLALDPGLGRLYVAAERGPLAVFAVDGATIQRLADGNAGPDAHSVAVDPATHELFLPLHDLGGKPVLRILAPVSA